MAGHVARMEREREREREREERCIQGLGGEPEAGGDHLEGLGSLQV